MIKLKDYIKFLQEIVRFHPESADFQVIYSHDDEGNEYQRVFNPPSLCQLHNPEQKSDRNLELVGFYGQINLSKKDCNAVIVN